jgi:hypothetical protein
MASLEKAARAYKAAALISLNTLVLFLLVNVLAWALRPLFGGTRGDPVSKTYGWDEVQKVYPDLSPDAMQQLLLETWSRPVVYESYTHFKEAPFAGRFIHVDTNGFRLSSNSGPWPPDTNQFNVFLFGGSTAFGYGLPDHQTLGSALQRTLSTALHTETRVYNFGRCFYQCTQERLLFEQLLQAGHSPKLAIFLDGLNDFFYPDGAPQYASQSEQLLSGQLLRRHQFDVLNKLPIVQLFRPSRPWRSEEMGQGETLDSLRAKPEELRTMVDAVCRRYLKNKELTERVAQAYQVQACFVWQPVPSYNYDIKYHLFAREGLGRHWRSKVGYERMAEWVRTEPAGPTFLWCADMQETRSEPLYVDIVHYSARMTELLATEITRQLLERHLLRP